MLFFFPDKSIGASDYFAQKPIDLNPVTGSITLPYLPSIGSSFQFCIKDSTLARRDLQRALGDISRSIPADAHAMSVLQLGSSQRGSKLFRYPNWEAKLLDKTLKGATNEAGLPIGGFLSECVFNKAASSKEPVIA